MGLRQRLRALFFPLRALLGRKRLEGDMDEELNLHLEMQAQHNRGRGMAPEEARRAARIVS